MYTKREHIELSSLPEAAQWVIEQSQGFKIWCLEGEMGAGKTTLTKSICQLLGVIDTVSSPTFSIVNEYKTINDEQIFHFDFYRIKHIDEAYDLGFESYLDTGCLCLIEWPERVESLLANEAVMHIHISKAADGTRTIECRA
ncbi:MAG: tRNA (adenosine(37)-N6)-threonylcarbamoyltransferase complex ATPase subunit type 1 TsaE [Bacteroidia bacterium]|nr:tRNA (adenosine(37)-N6)-threonylcarbamoyltransferase complex ATPase subunit type 1 TsaE [Bacteroidia bacterium]